MYLAVVNLSKEASVATGVAVLLFVLGFIALLAQRTYLDSRTRKPVAIELGPFGKMRTNYPALVFVFFGLALEVMVVQNVFDEGKSRVTWEIHGRLVDPAQRPVRWTDGQLLLAPQYTQLALSDDGGFSISAQIDARSSIDEVFSAIHYANREAGSAELFLGDAIKKYPDPSGPIRKLDTNCIWLRPLSIEAHYPESARPP